MTSRRCPLLEQGAAGMLSINGCRVRILPLAFRSGKPPVHLVALREGEQARYIRLLKIGRVPLVPATIESVLSFDIRLYRSRVLAKSQDPMPRCEIWTFSSTAGYRCYEVLPDRVVRLGGPGDIVPDQKRERVIR